MGTHRIAVGDGAVAAGNLLASTDVIDVMLAAFEHNPADTLAARLLHALTAARSAGGEAGPVHSAGLAVTHPTAGWAETDLRVDWHDEPIGELAGSGRYGSRNVRTTSPAACTRPAHRPTACQATSDRKRPGPIPDHRRRHRRRHRPGRHGRPLGLTVTVLGTPAEEGGGGKILMLDRGAFDGLHAAIMIHPGPADAARAKPFAVDHQHISYRGTTAHAAAYPELGVNAADAFTIAQVAIGLLHQQLPASVRVHGIVTHADSRPMPSPTVPRAAGTFAPPHWPNSTG